MNYFHLSAMTPYKGEVKTLKFKRKPMSLGPHEDVNGVTWDISVIMGNGKETIVCARPMSDFPSYYGTGTYDSQNGFHEWPPYKVEVVEAESVH
jgi:hypothetical protein